MAGAMTRVVFAAQHAVFAGMGIEARHRQARIQNAEIAAQRGQDDLAGVEHRLLGDRPWAHRPPACGWSAAPPASLSLASIITARRAPVRWARNSVWPGKAKPAAFSTDLWIGAVTMAAASPSRQACTAISMASVTAAALAALGLPGTAVTVRIGGDQRVLATANTPASPTSFRGCAADLAAEMVEGGKRDFRPDAGRLAHGDEDGKSRSALDG